MSKSYLLGPVPNLEAAAVEEEEMEICEEVEKSSRISVQRHYLQFTIRSVEPFTV